MPRVSIITTVFNGEKCVSQAFNNIAQLAHPDFEWIIVDDGSEDGSRSLIQDQVELHSDLRVRFITAGRIGRQAALNRAVEAADCEYICNQDIDDLSEPDRLSLQSDFLSQNNDVGILGGAYYVVDTVRHCRFARWPPTSHEALKRTMGKSVPFAHTISCFRRTVWEHVGGYPDYFVFIDLNFWILIVECGWKIHALDHVLGTHHIHPESFWHRRYSYRIKQAELSRTQIRAIRKLGLPKFYYMFPAMRYGYQFVPNALRGPIRRIVSEGTEEPIQNA